MRRCIELGCPRRVKGHPARVRCSFCRAARVRAQRRDSARVVRQKITDLPAWQIEAVIAQMAVYQRWARNQA
jgi:hypothetical protein